MQFAHKKIAQQTPTAQQNAQILAQVKSLLAKNLVNIVGDTVFFYSQIWKDSASAINWMKCLQQYAILKLGHKAGLPYFFRDIKSHELRGTIVNKQVKLLLTDFESNNSESLG